MKNTKKVQILKISSLLAVACATLPTMAASNGLCGPNSCTVIADLTGGSEVELFYRPDNTGTDIWMNGLTGISSLGGSGWKPFAGDFNGDGLDDLGAYKDGDFVVQWNDAGIFRSSNTSTYSAPAATGWGANTMPIIGDWDGDGQDDLGMYTDGTFQLFPDYNLMTQDITISFGSLPQNPGFVFTQMPFSGPIDNDPSGIYRVGVYFGNSVQYAPQTVDSTHDFFDRQSGAVTGTSIRPDIYARTHILQTGSGAPQFTFVMPPDVPALDTSVCTGGTYTCLNYFPDRPETEQPVVIPPDPFQ